MKVLVIGNGWIGNEIIQILRKKKINVQSTYREKKKLNLPKDKQIKFKSLFNKKIINQFEIVIYTVWYTNPKNYLVSRKNIEHKKMIINIAKNYSNPIGRFIGLGSCLEYYLNNNENYLTTKSSTKPNTLYGICKLRSYVSLKNIFQKKKIKFIWCRIFFLFDKDKNSKEQKGRLIPVIKSKIKQRKTFLIENPNFIRDYLPIKKAARMIVNEALNKKKGIVNICSGKGISIMSLVKSIFGKNKYIIFSNKQNQSQFIVGKR